MSHINHTGAIRSLLRPVVFPHGPQQAETQQLQKENQTESPPKANETCPNIQGSIISSSPEERHVTNYLAQAAKFHTNGGVSLSLNSEK